MKKWLTFFVSVAFLVGQSSVEDIPATAIRADTLWKR